MLSLCLTSSSLKSVCFSTAVVFSTEVQPHRLWRFHSLSFISALSLLSILSLNLSALILPTGWTFHLLALFETPLSCSRARRSDGHLSMSARFPAQKLFRCHSLRQGHPPVSSLSRQEKKLARGSDNPLTLHLSSVRGKAPF